MTSTLCVAFGSIEVPAVWATRMANEWVPEPGRRVQFQFRQDEDADRAGSKRFRANLDTGNEHDEDHDMTDAIVGHVTYADVQEDGEGIAFVYAGVPHPPVELQEILQANSWLRLSDEDARGVLDVIEHANPVAAVQDLMLVIGDPQMDADGVAPMETWSRIVQPYDPTLPLFGQRLILNAIAGDEVYDEDDESNEYEDDAAADAAAEAAQAAAAARVDQRQDEVDLWAPGSRSEGLPALVIYCTATEPGAAQVAFWVASLSDLDGFDLLAAGWEKFDPEVLNENGDFQLATRVRLALRTKLDIREDADGDSYVNDFEIVDAGSVPESSYPLLPAGLADHCRFAAELGDSDDIIGRWMNTGQ